MTVYCVMCDQGMFESPALCEVYGSLAAAESRCDELSKEGAGRYFIQTEVVR